MLKNNKGITLISLVITMIVLLILGSVATISGLEMVRDINFNNAKAQFQTMQNYANTWYEESENNSDVLNYGDDLNTANLAIVTTTLRRS